MKLKEVVILAGGKSSRMKFDKQKIIINGEYLIYKNIKKLEELFDEITIVTNTPDLYDDLNVKIIKDIYPGNGPISGVHSALSTSKNEFLYVLAVDMPNINYDYIKYVDSMYDENMDGLVYYNGKFIEPMHAIYNVRLIGKIEKLIKNKDYRIRSLVNTSNFIKITRDNLFEINVKDDIFTNLNTQEELLAYKEK